MQDAARQTPQRQRRTLPVGLCGVLMRIAFVLAEKAARSSSCRGIKTREGKSRATKLS